MKISEAVAVYVGIAALAFVVVYLLLKRLLKGKRSKLPTKPGTVVLHQFAPYDVVVSASPPCLKLETFLRMAKIPYENEYGLTFSKKGKMPWIDFNGQEVADSNFCIQFLNKEFQVDIDSHLSATEKAIAHSVRTMLEENAYWYVLSFNIILIADFTPLSTHSTCNIASLDGLCFPGYYPVGFVTVIVIVYYCYCFVTVIGLS